MVKFNIFKIPLFQSSGSYLGHPHLRLNFQVPNKQSFVTNLNLKLVIKARYKTVKFNLGTSLNELKNMFYEFYILQLT